MLATTRKTPPETSLHGYLSGHDVENRKWETNGTNESNVIICDKEVKLTEELRTYLLYFGYVVGGHPKLSLEHFSNLPIKQEN